MNTAIEIFSISETESSDESDFDAIVDDSDEDPTFDLIQDTQKSLSKLSIKKKKPSDENKIPQLDENEERSFELIEKLIHEGKFEKLKKEDCKIYLKRFGLRVTDKKEVLIERIKKHLEVKNGGGEKKYPVSSFVINCKGDACTRDVVLFEQTSCKKLDKKETSQNVKGPQNGTRIVAGRIIKESYGADKQQHTFTIEVLWSKGKKPYSALYPLRIKGRNLYKLKTMRQRWDNEEEREKILQEKHNRGDVARLCRERRIVERENRKIQIQNRLKGKSQIFQAPLIQPIVHNPHIKITPIQWDPQQNKNDDITSGPHHMFDRVNYYQRSPPILQDHNNQTYPARQYSNNKKYGATPDMWGPHRDNKTNAVISDTWDPPQRENKRSEYGGPGARYNSGGPGVRYNDGGPGVRYNDGGPGVRHNDGGPGVRFNGGGPGAQYNDGGPGARYNDGGPGARYNDGGPGVRYNDGGPGARFNGGPVQREVCRHFVRGHCWYGQECKFIHDSEN